MSDHSGDVLRQSLDAVDSYRRRIIAALVFTGVLLLIVFLYGAQTAGTDVVSSFLAHFVMLLIWVTGLTLIVIIQIAAMTRRILRAIELAANK